MYLCEYAPKDDFTINNWW